MSAIHIGDRPLGEGAPCFVIAEIGVNHNGDPELAHELIDACADAQADAVKFQTFVPEALAAAGAPKADYQKPGTAGESQLAMLRRLALPRSAYRELLEHARERNVVFLSSPFDEASVDLLAELGVPAIKIPSGEVTNHPLLRRIAATGKPLLMSTGMCTMDEVDDAVALLRGSTAGALALLHCVSSYPTEPRDCNLRAMDTLRERFGVPVGWSDHTLGSTVAIAAVALGADVVEKHVTLSRELPGPDHRASIEPGELGALMRAVRDAQSALGRADKGPVQAEAEVAAVARKSLHWKHALPAGHLVADADLVALRPGHGIAPSRLDSLVGRRLRLAVEQGSIARPEEFE